MNTLYKIATCLGLVFQLLIASSCYYEEPKDLSNVIDNLLIEYYVKKIAVYSNPSANENSRECNSNLVDHLILDNKFFYAKNFYSRNIQLSDSFFIDKSFELFRIVCFDTRERVYKSAYGRKTMPITASKFLCQKHILGDLCGIFASEDMKILHPWKLNYSNLYETYLLPVLIEKKSGDQLLELDYLLLITVQENKIRAIVELARSVVGHRTGYKTFTRTNRKYFFIKTESLYSNVAYKAPPIETMPVVPRNIEFYTQFYFDGNGYVKFVEEYLLNNQ